MGSRSVASGGCIHSSSQTFQTSLRVARPKLVVRASTVDVFTAPQAQTWSPALKPADSATRAVERSLREWITAHGGFIHTSIRLTDNAPCGCRGVVASSPLTREDVEDPILVVPENLYLTTDNARAFLRPLDEKIQRSSSSGSRSAPASQGPGAGLLSGLKLPLWGAGGARRPTDASGSQALPAVAQLGLLVAVERARGDQSFWAPYIQSLPAAPSCAWAMPPQQLKAALVALGPTAEGWGAAVERARAGVYGRAEAAVRMYGRHLDVELDVEDVVWGMGQVSSRASSAFSDL